LRIYILAVLGSAAQKRVELVESEKLHLKFGQKMNDIMYGKLLEGIIYNFNSFK
jgi:hypothetical protein